MRWLRQIWEAYGRYESIWGFLSSDLLKPWTFPLAAGILTMLSALLSAVPAPYLVAVTFFVMACVATTLVRMDEWSSRISPNGKFNFQAPLFGPDVDSTVTPHRFKAIQLGLQLSNSATFPIKFQVESIYTQFMGRVCVRKDYDIGIIIDVPAGGYGWFRDSIIPIDVDMPTGQQEGQIEFKLHYWKNDRSRVVLERKFRIYANFDPLNKGIAFNWVSA